MKFIRFDCNFVGFMLILGMVSLFKANTFATKSMNKKVNFRILERGVRNVVMFRTGRSQRYVAQILENLCVSRLHMVSASICVARIHMVAALF